MELYWLTQATSIKTVKRIEKVLILCLYYSVCVIEWEVLLLVCNWPVQLCNYTIE